jgi:hypothetical protein
MKPTPGTVVAISVLGTNGLLAVHFVVIAATVLTSFLKDLLLDIEKHRRGLRRDGVVKELEPSLRTRGGSENATDVYPSLFVSQLFRQRGIWALGAAFEPAGAVSKKEAISGVQWRHAALKPGFASDAKAVDPKHGDRFGGRVVF